MSAEERIIFDEVKAALAAEQREHAVTTQRYNAARDEVDHERKMHHGTSQLLKTLRNDLNEERKLNNAALKPSAEVLQQEQDDEMACMAEEVVGLKAEIADLQGAVDGANELRDSYKRTALTLSDDNAKLRQKIEALELVEVALRTDVSRLEGYRVELESSAITQAQFMQQIEAACKAAEARVIEQRKELESRVSRIKDLITESDALYIENMRMKQGRQTCKECATLRDEIINRDAVILQYESREEDREEIIKALAKENKVLRYVHVATPTTVTYTIMFSGKAGDMQKPNKTHACKWYSVCTIASEIAHECTANEGQHCGRRREIDAAHGVKLW